MHSSDRYFLETYDMRGKAVLSCYALSWEPWLDVEDCLEPPDVNCSSIKSSGILKDVMNLLADAYNFSWSLDREMRGDWGGVYSTSRTFSTGVLGAVINRSYDLSLSGEDHSLQLTMHTVCEGNNSRRFRMQSVLLRGAAICSQSRQSQVNVS